MRQPGRIAIDGPAGSGKSTIGEKLAQRLGYLYVDTGAMYRALTWVALQKGIDIRAGEALASLARDAHMLISHPDVQDGRQYTVRVNGEDVTWAIRGPAVTSAVSAVSGHAEVRAVLIGQQRELARRGEVVMVGRDIGAIVLPDAELKIFLTASPQERARRRYLELQQRVKTTHAAPPTLDSVLQDIQRRDALDQDNLLHAADAFVVDTDDLSVEEALELIVRHMEEQS